LFDGLDWRASTTPVKLNVELPFWIMVPNCSQQVEVNGHIFNVEIRDDYIEQYANVISDSRLNCFYIGPPKSIQTSQKKNVICRSWKKDNMPIMARKCKTVLRIHSDCNKDVLMARKQGGARGSSADIFLRNFCMAHIRVINHLVQHYRLSTYDYFAYEVSPWDVPIWFVESDVSSGRVVLLNYAEWDKKPIVKTVSGSLEGFRLIEETELQSALTAEPSAGEFELLDSINFMERGDYSGAIRRITTAIEAQTESVLRQELLKTHTVAEAEAKLEASKNDFPGRLRQYEKLSRRKLPNELHKELDATRDLRHAIVHRAFRINLNQRGQAQRAVDTGRWIFNWLENQPSRRDVREKRLAERSFGRILIFLNMEITPAGVVIYKPPL
jgi:hypothetical protein